MQSINSQNMQLAICLSTYHSITGTFNSLTQSFRKHLLGAYYVQRGTNVEHKHRTPAFRKLTFWWGKQKLIKESHKEATYYRSAWHPAGLLQATGE